MDARIRDVLGSKGSTVHSVDADASVYDAVRVMNGQRIGSVLVVRGGRLVGILSERDVLLRVVPEGGDPHKILVAEVMTGELETVGPDSRIHEVMRIMTDRRVRHLPVVEGDTVIGLVSIGDLTKWVSRDLQQEVHDLSSYIIGTSVVRPFIA